MPPPGASEKASHDPSGDQETLPTGSSNAVTCSGQPPEVETTKIWGIPVRFDTKARRLPSGEKLGFAQNPIFTIADTDRSRFSGVWGDAAGTAAARRIGMTNSLFIVSPGLPSARRRRKAFLLALDEHRVLGTHHLADRSARRLRNELVGVHLRE